MAQQVDARGPAWVAAANGEVPELAMLAGYDTPSRSNIYVARASIDNQIVLGKVMPTGPNRCAYFGVNGAIIELIEYEVLTNPGGQLKWKRYGGAGGIPWGAKPGGRDANMMTTYIARGRVDNDDWCCGKFDSQSNRCYLPNEAREVIVAEFELLVGRQV